MPKFIKNQDNQLSSAASLYKNLEIQEKLFPSEFTKTINGD
jgi:phage anti-repressor protein